MKKTTLFMLLLSFASTTTQASQDIPNLGKMEQRTWTQCWQRQNDSSPPQDLYLQISDIFLQGVRNGSIRIFIAPPLQQDLTSQTEEEAFGASIGARIADFLRPTPKPMPAPIVEPINGFEARPAPLVEGPGVEPVFANNNGFATVPGALARSIPLPHANPARVTAPIRAAPVQSLTLRTF